MAAAGAVKVRAGDMANSWADVGLWPCALKARIISGGRFHQAFTIVLILLAPRLPRMLAPFVAVVSVIAMCLFLVFHYPRGKNAAVGKPITLNQLVPLADVSPPGPPNLRGGCRDNWPPQLRWLERRTAHQFVRRGRTA